MRLSGVAALALFGLAAAAPAIEGRATTGTIGGRGGINFRRDEQEAEHAHEMSKRISIIFPGPAVAVGPGSRAKSGDVVQPGSGKVNGRDLEELVKRQAKDDKSNLERAKGATIVLPGVGVGVNGGQATPGSTPEKPGIHFNSKRFISFGGDAKISGGGTRITSGSALAIGQGAIAKSGDITGVTAGKGSRIIAEGGKAEVKDVLDDDEDEE